MSKYQTHSLREKFILKLHFHLNLESLVRWTNNTDIKYGMLIYCRAENLNTANSQNVNKPHIN